MKKTGLLILLLIVAILLGAKTHENTRGWIERNVTDDTLSIIAYASSESDIVINYVLKAESKGPAGDSNLSQKGEITLNKGVKQPLSNLNISYDQEKQVFVTLKLYANGSLIYEITE